MRVMNKILDSFVLVLLLPASCKLFLSSCLQKRVNRAFETMFETGVDEMSWDDTVRKGLVKQERGERSDLQIYMYMRREKKKDYKLLVVIGVS